jgi:DNA-binding Lrp family transcriptional regulator|tara:strand:- start:347 stop:814 length:468 start_codon:yes stop_codon:yes gene_type:complete
VLYVVLDILFDDIDRKIINEYLQDSRLSYREVAKRLGLAVGTVMTRTKKLESNGLIEAYSVILNHVKLGYELTAITEIKVSKGKLIEMENEIAKMKVTCAVYDVTGDNDAIIIGKFKNRDELNQFTKKLLSLSFVERTNTHIVLDTIKEDFRLPA